MKCFVCEDCGGGVKRIRINRSRASTPAPVVALASRVHRAIRVTLIPNRARRRASKSNLTKTAGAIEAIGHGNAD
jgi:hypothetical protein